MLTTFKYSKACAFLTIILAAAAVAPQAFSTPLTVTSLADSGAGTLRDRILTNDDALGGQGGPTSSGLAGGGGEGYGGAIACFGSLTMVRCTLAGNSALGGPGGPAPSPGFGSDGRGGGLYLEGSANVSYSTLAANNAVAGQGGAGAGTGLGGGIFSWNSSTLNVNTCTIVSNTASGSTI